MDNGKDNSDKAREAYLKIEEIENRFADMLSTQQRKDLENKRGKKQEEADKFWDSSDTK